MWLWLKFDRGLIPFILLLKTKTNSLKGGIFPTLTQSYPLIPSALAVTKNPKNTFIYKTKGKAQITEDQR